jgi:glycosyltransferase involved in cell wall biosynthesis
VHGPQLVDAMASARVYTQLSAYESFGMAVAEAMLCGCAPVVSDRGALPEVVGDCGFIVPYGDVAATVQAIRAALEVGEEERKRYRQRIVENFSLESRRAQLLAALEECLRH